MKIAVPSLFSVHLLTASGAALAFLALVAAMQANWAIMFLWLGGSLIVDGVDGAIARRLRVAERLPRWSGETLDLVVDFVTYVFVPAYAISASGVLPQALSTLAGMVIVVTGALYFGDRQMKTADNHFRGFPAAWSLIAFYLILLQPPQWVSAAIVAALAVATFVPVPFVHPLRVAWLRPLNIVLLGLGSVLAIVAVLRDLKPEPWITGAMCAIGLYFLCAGLLRRANK